MDGKNPGSLCEKVRAKKWKNDDFIFCGKRYEQIWILFFVIYVFFSWFVREVLKKVIQESGFSQD